MRKVCFIEDYILWAFGVLGTSEKGLGRISSMASRQLMTLELGMSSSSCLFPLRCDHCQGPPSPPTNLSLTHHTEPHPGLRGLERLFFYTAWFYTLSGLSGLLGLPLSRGPAGLGCGMEHSVAAAGAEPLQETI